MVRGTERYLFGDCALNINPDAEALAEIAINSAITAKMFGIQPKIAMLSYSTKGSGFGDSVDKVVEATKLAHDLRPDLEIDGELQFDAAFVPETAALKAPGSNVAGQANVFIFPGIEAGNIGYKIAERLGGFAAIGPVLQGLNKPVNDLSRGCNPDDVYKLTLITAAQAINQYFHHCLKNLTITWNTNIMIDFKQTRQNSHDIAVYSRLRQVKSNTRNGSCCVRANSFQTRNSFIGVWKLAPKVSHNLLGCSLHITNSRIITQTFPSLQ